MAEIAVIYSQKLSSWHDKRYVVVNKNTQEILDDAQGYGYRTPQKAYAAYGYKHRDKSKDKEKAAKKKRILVWMKEHNDFVQLMDQIAFEIAKGSWGPDEKFDAKLVGQLLKESEFEPDFSPADLLKVWRSGD